MKKSATTLFKCKRVRTFLLLLISAMLVLAAGSSAAAKTFRWRVQHPWPSGSMYDDQTKLFAENVKKLSDGRLNITMFGVGTLAGTFESFDSISKGVYDGHISVSAYWSGKMPIGTFLTGVAGGIETQADWNAWFYNYGGLEIAREAYANFKIYFVGPVMAPANTPIFTRKDKPVRSVADLKGLKLRSSPGLQSELLKAVGASPVLIPVQDVYTSLETGVVDGVTGYTTVGWKNIGIHEVAKYAMEPGFVLRHSCLEFCAGQKAWDKLPDDLKSILESCVRNFSTGFFGFGLVEDAKAYNVMKETGVEVLHLPEDEVKGIFQKAVKVNDTYAQKDPLAEKAWESQKSYLRLIGKMK